MYYHAEATTKMPLNHAAVQEKWKQTAVNKA